MAMTSEYAVTEPTRAEIDAITTPLLVEFGAPWCPHCQGAQPKLAEAFAGHETLRHIKVEDGPGRPLGRSFRVKLWPTLIFLKEGREVARLVRPTDANEIRQSLAAIDTPTS